MTRTGGRPYTSIIIPAYDEETRLGRSLPLIDAYVRERGLDAEIIVVDDGSRDGTSRVAETFLRGRRGQLLRSPENRGKGHAVRRGVLAAEGRWALITDADLAAPIEEHQALAARARERDLDVAIGSRSIPGSPAEPHGSALRRLLGRMFNLATRQITGLSFHDTQCGFKLLDRERTRPLFERMVVDGFAYDVELLFLCVRFGLRVEEVPVAWHDVADTKVGMIRDPLAMLIDLARIRWRFRRGAYNPLDDRPGHA